MAHPYKSYDEHRHGRKVAKNRYDSGGIVRFPNPGGMEAIKRQASANRIDMGRVPPREGNVVYGPGVNPTTGGPKRSWLSRQEERDQMPRAKGGRITGGAESGIGRLQRNKIQARLRKK